MSNTTMEENQTRRALLIIDLQQDFTSPNGPFKQSCVKADHIISNLNAILPDFRDHNGIVIWIKADYSKLIPEPKYLTRPEGEKFEDVPLNDDLLSGSHKTYPLCVPGTDGAKFTPEVESLIKEDQDVVVNKTYYSAFTNTNLADILRDVKEVHICGLMTNVCVQATATDAFFHGYKVFVWTDCLGYRKEKAHRRAFSNLRRWYATMITSDKYLRQLQNDTSKPVLYFVNGSIPSWRVMMALYEKGIDFEAKRLKVMSRPKETKSPEFLAINPRGLTPTLVDTDDSVIAESLAILHYLETYYPNKLPLIPIEKVEHIKVLQRIQESQNLVDIYEPLEEVVFKTPKDEQSSHKDSIIKTLQLIDQELAFWEMYLTKTTFIACNIFTLADCAFYPVVAYLIHRGLNIDQFPALKNYVNLIKRKAAAIKSHPSGWTEKGGKVNVFRVVRNIVANCNNEHT
jgi:nicotinamidase-related amidase/glutathione S-transferase